jgi:hypothetical protein
MKIITGIIFAFILIVLPFILVYLWIKKKSKQEEEKRKLDIDKSLENWESIYKKEKLKMSDLPHDKYLNVKDSKSKYTRMEKYTFFIDDFYQKDLDSKIYFRSLINVFGEDKGKQYFESGFELGLNKQDILTVLGKPKEWKKEILKTKTKETLYYSYTKSENFYVFDDDVLVKIVK